MKRHQDASSTHIPATTHGPAVVVCVLALALLLPELSRADCSSASGAPDPGPCKEFCVGPNCFVEEDAWVTDVPPVTAQDLTFTFSMIVDVVAMPPGSSFDALEVQSPGGSRLLWLTVSGTAFGGSELSLTYHISPSVTGTLALGPVQDGEFEAWTIHRRVTPTGQGSSITVTRDNTVYTTGPLVFSRGARTIIQDASNLVGSPDCRLLETEAMVQ